VCVCLGVCVFVCVYGGVVMSVRGSFSPFLLNILMRSSPACSRKKKENTTRLSTLVVVHEA